MNKKIIALLSTVSMFAIDTAFAASFSVPPASGLKIYAAVKLEL